MENTLDITHPELAKEWHPVKNTIKPNEITHGVRKKFWWLGKCGHEWESRLDGRVYAKRGCPFCNCNRATGTLIETHPELCKEWSVLNEQQPSEFTKGSIKKVWWDGPCGHSWQATIRNRTNKASAGNKSCSFCANRQTNETNSLLTLYPNIAEEWHPTKNGTLTPDKINPKVYKKIWWLGKCGHEWECLVRTRTRKIRPTNCPQCKQSKGEEKIESILQDLKISYQKEVRFKTCKDIRSLPFDFRIGKILIEYQGIQHYKPIDFGYKKDLNEVFKEIQRRDQIKRDWCCNNNFKLVEISYTEFENIPNIIERLVYFAQEDI